VSTQILAHALLVHLETQGVGTQGMDLFSNDIPPEPDPLISVIEDDGGAPELTFGSTRGAYVARKQNVMILARSADHNTARQAMDAVFAELTKLAGITAEGLDLLWAAPLGEIKSRAKDKEDRYAFTQRYNVMYRKGVPPPIHQWTYDDVYTDAVGSITFVPQMGTPTFEAALINNGVRCTASAGNLLASGLTQAVIDGGSDGPFSVAGWVKQNSAGSTWSMLYAIDSSPFTNIWFVDNNNAQDESEFFVAGVTGSLNAKGPRITSTGVWVFMAGVYDPTGPTATLYLGEAGVLTSYPHTGSITGGRKNNADSLRGPYFSGGDFTQDQMRIWDEAVSPAHMQQLYDAERP